MLQLHYSNKTEVFNRILWCPWFDSPNPGPTSSKIRSSPLFLLWGKFYKFPINRRGWTRIQQTRSNRWIVIPCMLNAKSTVSLPVNSAEKAPIWTTDKTTTTTIHEIAVLMGKWGIFPLPVAIPGTAWTNGADLGKIQMKSFPKTCFLTLSLNHPQGARFQQQGQQQCTWTLQSSLEKP